MLTIVMKTSFEYELLQLAKAQLECTQNLHQVLIHELTQLQSLSRLAIWINLICLACIFGIVLWP